MTGGVVVILGETGKNFAAGMSGGIAYVLDEKNRLYKNLNNQMVSMEPVEDKNDLQELKAIIEEHVRCTGSAKGRDVLEHFNAYASMFKKIIPYDYKNMLKGIGGFREQGADQNTAEELAFRAFVEGSEE